MSKTSTIRLERNYIGQIINGLVAGLKQHGIKEYEYLESDNILRDGFVIKKCFDADGALAIAADYGRIIASIAALMKTREALA